MVTHMSSTKKIPDIVMIKAEAEHKLTKNEMINSRTCGPTPTEYTLIRLLVGSQEGSANQ
jgi:hypothetical protein